jgi:hypothetical protein
MQFYGRHGVNPEEQTLGQRFEVDVELRLDTRPAALQDDLRLTINYAQVYKAVKRIVEEGRIRPVPDQAFGRDADCPVISPNQQACRLQARDEPDSGSR